MATKRAPSRTAARFASSSSKSNVRWKPTTTAVGGPVVDRSEPGVGQRLDHARPRARQHPRAGCESTARATRPRRCALVIRSPGVGGHAHAFELGHDVTDRRVRVVRHEHDPQSGGAQLPDAAPAGRDRVVPPPDHAVEVTADDRTGTALASVRRVDSSAGVTAGSWFRSRVSATRASALR